jgi:hypothetical protein
MQSAPGPALGNEISHPRFDNRTAAGLHGFYLRQTEINADYVVPLMREAGCGDSTHIAQPEHAYRLSHAMCLFPFPGLKEINLCGPTPCSAGFQQDPGSAPQE